jgi:hypothetical protein
MSRTSTPKNCYWSPAGALLIVFLAAVLAAGQPAPITAAGAIPVAAVPEGSFAPVTAADVPPLVVAASGTVTSGTPGPNAVFPITVTGVQKLGAASVVVGYDPASLKPVACQRGPAFDVGVCNRSYDRNGDGTADAVLFSVLSVNGVSATDTAVPLINITWQAVAAVPGEKTTALTVEVRTFTDTDARPLTYATQDGQITLLPPPPPTTPTSTATATPTATATATLTPTATAHERTTYLPLVLRTP